MINVMGELGIIMMILDMNFDAIEKLLEQLLHIGLEITETAKFSYLMTDPSIHDKKGRQKMCEIIFEKLNAPSYFVVKKAVLSAFSIGR